MSTPTSTNPTTANSTTANPTATTPAGPDAAGGATVAAESPPAAAAPARSGGAPRAVPTTPGVPGTPRLRFHRVLHSEWIRMWSLRSTVVTLVATLAVIVGLGLVAAAVTSGQVEGDAATGGGPPGLGGADPMTVVLAGVDFAVLIVGVLGALAGAREYGTGMIRTTLAAVPRRLSVLWARALTLVAVVFPLALVGVSVAFTAGNGILEAGNGATLAWSDDGVVRALLGEAAYVTAVAVMGLGLGFLLRSTAAAIGTLVGGLLFLPTLGTLLLPDSWDPVLEYLPSNAGAALSAVVESDTLLSPGAGGLVLVGWVAVVLLGAAAALRIRDA